jgi:hypothetical protein
MAEHQNERDGGPCNGHRWLLGCCRSKGKKRSDDSEGVMSPFLVMMMMMVGFDLGGVEEKHV